jgi:hypothetical protein
LEASEVGREAGEVAAGGAVVALGWFSNGLASAFVRRGPSNSWAGSDECMTDPSKTLALA